MNIIAQNLAKAKDLIVTKGWGRYNYSSTKDGRPCSFADEEAVCFCTMGAIYAASGSQRISQNAVLAEIRALGFEGEGEVLVWNDDRYTDLDQVLARFDRAIEQLLAA